jgi:hypothetical protein
MSYAFVQGRINTTNTASPAALAFNSNNTQGNLLVITGRGTLGGNTVAVTDSQGNTWTLFQRNVSGGNQFFMGYVLNCPGGANTVTVTAAGQSLTYAISEHSCSRTMLFDTQTNAAPVGTNPNTGNINTAIANELLIGVCGLTLTTGMTAGSGYTLREGGGAGTNTGVIEDNFTNTAGTNSASFVAATGTYGVGIMAFKPLSNITGSAGVAGATVSWSGAASGSTTADGSGNYMIPNLIDGSYTITPSKTGYTFSPSSSPQTVAGADISGVNFTVAQIVVATPTFSPVAGTYSGTQSVTISCTDSGLAGFAMYYTTDGSTPTTGSTPYIGTISVAATETIKVLAAATGYANSNIGSAAYTITAPAPTVAGDGPLNSVLFPVLMARMRIAAAYRSRK